MKLPSPTVFGPDLAVSGIISFQRPRAINHGPGNMLVDCSFR